MRSVVRRPLAVLAAFVTFGAAGLGATAEPAAAQSDTTVPATPPPTITGSKVTAAPTTTAAPRPVATAAPTAAPSPRTTARASTKAPATTAAAASAPSPTEAPSPTAAAAVPSAAPATSAQATDAPKTVAASVLAPTTLASAAATTDAPAASTTSTPVVGDQQATRSIRRISWTLAALAGGLLALTLWFWRLTRPVPVELGGLAVMGTRRWRRARSDTREALVADSRPARLGDGEELFVNPVDVPGHAPSVAAPVFDAPAPVLPGAIPPPPPLHSSAAGLATMAPVEHPAHLSVAATPVISPPDALISDGSTVAPSPGQSLRPADAPARPVDLEPAIQNLSPLADVVVVHDADPGSVHIDPIPADDEVSVNHG